MSGDEIIALLASLAIGFLGWRAWLSGLLLIDPLFRKSSTQVAALLAPAIAAAATLFVLVRWSSSDVRSDGTYILFYLAMGFGWTGLWNWLIPFLGLDFRYDALERENAAAAIACSGGLLGVSFVYAGSNIGEGPGWWVVVFCSALGTAVMLALWMVANLISPLADSITIDRDTATAWRVAGFFGGSGLILGRALAGDWHSPGATIADFLEKVWPVLVLWAAMLMLDRVARPTPRQPAPDRWTLGLLPALALLGAGVGDLVILGHW